MLIRFVLGVEARNRNVRIILIMTSMAILIRTVFQGNTVNKKNEII